MDFDGFCDFLDHCPARCVTSELMMMLMQCILGSIQSLEILCEKQKKNENIRKLSIDLEEFARREQQMQSRNLF